MSLRCALSITARLKPWPPSKSCISNSTSPVTSASFCATISSPRWQGNSRRRWLRSSCISLSRPGLRSRNPRGNSGDLGRAKTSRASRTQSQARLNSAEAQPRTVGHNRKRRRWFSRKYYASVMRIKEFYEDNIGKTFTGILSDFARNVNSKM